MEISLGALTYHHFNTKHTHHFEKCIGNCQAIANPLVNVGFNKHNVFIGANSIARPMAGYRYNITLNSFSNLTVGGYYQNNGAYNDKKIHLVYAKGDVIPLVGTEFKYKSLGLLLTYPISVLYWKF